MKKSLLAMAVAAALPAVATAQVTIYGVLDVAGVKLTGHEFGLQNTTNSYPQSQSATALVNSFARAATSTNHIGFRGVEELGGGWTAGFNLQVGNIDMSTGSQGLTFGREANLSLGRKDLGEFKFGRTVSTMCSVGCSFDYNYIGAGNALALIGISPAINKGSSRRSDLIEFASAPISGITVRVGVQNRGDLNTDGTFVTSGGSEYSATSSGAGKDTKKSNFDNVYALGVNYAQGPLRAAFVVETPNNDSNAVRNAQWLGVEYDFRVVKTNLQYMVNTNKGGATVPKASGTGTDDRTGLYALSTATGVTTYGKGYALAAVAPFGAWNFGVQWANNTEQGVKGTELFTQYSLSKRTTVFAYNTKLGGAKAITADTFYGTAPAGASASNAVQRTALAANPSIFAIGIRHTF